MPDELYRFTGKDAVKEMLLRLGLYYKITNYRFRHDARNLSQQQFYASLLGRDDMVFDVGANIGQRSQIFAALCRKVVAIEPQAECLKHLRSRFKFTKKVVIESVALSDAGGEAVIYESDSHTLSSMSREFIESVSQERFKTSHWNRAVTIKTQTLDYLIKKHGLPKFIKIDVEGFEINVLKGLSKAVPFLSFEYNPELIQEARSCIDIINRITNQYHYNYCLGEELDFVLPHDLPYTDFINQGLPAIAQQGNFGDIYAVLS